MNIQVTPHTIAITINNNINAGEYNITPCEFNFTEEYENLTKEAIFSSCDGSVIKTSILNNQCTIPFEVLQQEGNVLLGVYAYETDDDELVLRYSPTPQYFNVKKGSFQVGNDPDLPSPTEWERVLEQINQAIEETNNLNITANKEGKVTTVTITKKDGTTQEVEINDGKDLEFKWQGTSLGVRQEGQSEYEYTDLKGATGNTGATPNIQIGDVQTGDTSEVTRTGTNENPILNFTLEKGDTGNGIASITKTSTSGLVDTYTITFTNGQTTTYEITNGANGSVVDVQVDGTSVVDNGIANIIGLTEMKQELEDMYNLLPKVQGTGEIITLNGTVVGKMLIDLKGNTSQETTTQSKNLMPNEAESQTINGLTITKGTDGSLLINGTSTATAKIELGTTNLASGTYTLSTHKEGTTTNSCYLRTVDTTTESEISGTSFNIYSSNSKTYTLSENKKVKFDFYTGVNRTFTNFKIYPMAESGSTATDYVEFVPNSPNPDYPQDIHVVSGDNSIDVCGKNSLNDYDLVNRYKIANINGNVLTTTATSTDWDVFQVLTKTQHISLSQGVDYYVSCDVRLASGTFSGKIGNARLIDTNANALTGAVSAIENPNVSSSFQRICYKGTATNDFNNRLGIQVQVPTGLTNAVFEIKNLMISTSSDLNYQPYASNSYQVNLGSIELCKIGDYQDYFYKDSGKWYLHKEIGKVVLASNLGSWSNPATYQYNISGLGFQMYTAYDLQLGVCNKLRNTPTQSTDGAFRTYVSNNNLNNVYNIHINKNAIRFWSTNFATLQSFKDWVDGQHPIMYYVLTTPTYTQITDTTLQQQLNALEKARSYNSQTNLTQTNDDISFIITATALESITNS